MLAVFARGMSNMDTHFAQDYRELMSAAGEAAHPPVIFLDIDGVLNRTSGATHIRLDQDLVSRLRTIVQRSGCRIVLSTFWRGFDAYVRYILHRHGIDAALVIGVTPGSEHGSVTPMVTERRAAQASLGLEASAHDDTQYASRPNPNPSPRSNPKPNPKPNPNPNPNPNSKDTRTARPRYMRGSRRTRP